MDEQGWGGPRKTVASFCGETRVKAGNGHCFPVGAQDDRFRALATGPDRYRDHGRSSSSHSSGLAGEATSEVLDTAGTRRVSGATTTWALPTGGTSVVRIYNRNGIRPIYNTVSMPLVLLGLIALFNVVSTYDDICYCPGDAGWDTALQDKLLDLRKELDCQIEWQFRKLQLLRVQY